MTKWLGPATAAVLLVAGGLHAQDSISLPSDSVIRQAEQEGRRIAAYDFAVRHATQELLGAGVEQNRISLYVARQEDGLWHVYFGSINVLSSEFRTAYEVVQKKPDGKKFSVHRKLDAEPADQELSRAATALITALAAFEPQWERYETYVWLNSRGEWVTYFLPGPTVTGQWPIGADMRVLVSFDAKRVLQSVTFHANLTLVKPSRKEAIATHHRHLAGENPAPTDFAYVLINPQLAPMALVANGYTCTVRKNGTFGGCEVTPPGHEN